MKTLECGCKVEWPKINNHAAVRDAKKSHEEECSAYKAIRDAVRADHDQRVKANLAKYGPRIGPSLSEFLRGDDERHVVDAYYGEGTYDSEFTTDAEIDKAIGG